MTQLRWAMPAIALVLALAVPVPNARAQNFDTVQVRTIDVAPGVHMLMGSGGNIGVSAGEDGAFLIDDQYAPLTEKIVAAIRELSDAPIRFVLNTHWHGDHTGGNENLGEAGAIIVAHENVRERMSVDQFVEAFDRTIPAAPEGALPIVTFTDAVTFHLNGDELHAFHVENAHTDGDAIIHFRNANVVHMGDTYFAGMYPFIDLSAGGSIEGMIRAADIVLRLADAETRIIPGHGQLSNRGELRAYRDMLADVRDAVRREVAAGKSRDEVIAGRPTAAFDEVWDNGFIDGDRFAGIVYSDLAGDP